MKKERVKFEHIVPELAERIEKERAEIGLGENELYEDGLIFRSFGDTYVEHLFERYGYGRWSYDNYEDLDDYRLYH